MAGTFVRLYKKANLEQRNDWNSTRMGTEAMRLCRSSGKGSLFRLLGDIRSGICWSLQAAAKF
jgi:hypothetical protein